METKQIILIALVCMIAAPAVLAPTATAVGGTSGSDLDVQAPICPTIKHEDTYVYVCIWLDDVA